MTLRETHSPVLVTGANSGIGLAVVRTLASQGAQIIATDLVDNNITRLIAEYSNVQYICCDMSVGVDVAKLISSVVEGYSSLSGIVLAAGVTHEGLVGSFSPDDWNYIFQVNVTAPFRLLNGLLSLLLCHPHSAIVAIGSVSASVIGAGGGCAAYEASKAALTQLVRAVAIEYADTGLRANVIAPGKIDTGLGRTRDHFIERGILGPLPQKRRRNDSKHRPIARAGRAEEVAELVAYLLSDRSAFITGAELKIDGGYSAV